MKMFQERSFFHSPKSLTSCCCIQLSKQRAVTDDSTLCEDREEDRSGAVGAQGGNGVTGVKQLSSLAAPGEKMLLNQEGVSHSSPLLGDSKPWGQRSQRAAMEAICLVVRAQQVSPGQGDLATQNISPGKRKRKYPHSHGIRNVRLTHTLVHSPHTRHNNPCLLLLYPEFTLCLLCSDVRKMLN